jgi:hypothetical protein
MPSDVIWVGYEKKKPRLPVAIADSDKELAERMGVTVSTVRSAWSRYWRGLSKSTKYAMVFLDEEDEHGEE